MGTLSRNAFWRIGIFRIAIAVSILFLLLTVIAMFLYPGGTMANHHSRGYAFFLNFFSDLGRTSTLSGQPNNASRILFTIALTAGALCLPPFFIALTPFFVGSGMALWLSRLGAVCSLVTCIGFTGVAFVPIDISLQVHNLFLDTAFLSFLLAFLLLFLAALLTPGFPRLFVQVFGAFATLLAAYIVLLIFGPPAGTPGWIVVQATGQKIIVYAAILTALIQALSVQPLLLKNVQPPQSPL